MHSQDNPTSPTSMIDRVASAVARGLDTTPPAASPRKDLIGAARSWSAYLDELALCAERGGRDGVRNAAGSAAGRARWPAGRCVTQRRASRVATRGSSTSPIVEYPATCSADRFLGGSAAQA